MARQFRKKPIILEAFKLGVDNIPDWFMDRVTDNEIIVYRKDKLISADIITLDGTMTAQYGDMVVKGAKGEVYPCKPDNFYATFDEV